MGNNPQILVGDLNSTLNNGKGRRLGDITELWLQDPTIFPYEIVRPVVLDIAIPKELD